MTEFPQILRCIRTEAGLSLADVEAKSGGRWKAVVVGSYERGTRQGRLSAMADLFRFYGHRLAVLGPDDVVVRAGDPGPSLDAGTIVEWLVVYGDSPGQHLSCGSAAQAAEVAAVWSGAVVGHRTIHSSAVTVPRLPGHGEATP